MKWSINRFCLGDDMNPCCTARVSCFCLCPDNLRATKERQVSVNLVEGQYHDIVLEYREEGGSASVQVCPFVRSPETTPLVCLSLNIAQ